MTHLTRSAWKVPWAWTAFLVTAALGLVADLWSKAAVFDWLLRVDPFHRFPSVQIIPGVMKFTLQTNQGMAFGLSAGPYLIQGATVAAIAAVFYFFLSSPAGARWTHVALGLIAGGALGNLYDRIGLGGPVQLPESPAAVGQVRDFIDFGQIGYRWVFNIADVLLVAGVGILMVSWFLEGRRQAGPAKAASGKQDCCSASASGRQGNAGQP